MIPTDLSEVDILLIGGLQGAGKSSLAEAWFGDRRRVNRDEIRAFHTRMTRGRSWRPQDWTREIEPMVTDIEMAILRMELGRGHQVVVDNTVITPELRAPYIELAREMGRTVGCFFLHLPLEFCQARNQQRDRKVPEDVLQRFHAAMQLPCESEGLDAIQIVDRPVRLH